MSGSGGILQLVATGIDTVYLTGDPTITLFKCVYRRHTNFTVTQSNCIVKNVKKFDSHGEYTIEKKGDCVSNMLMRIDIGDFNVKYLDSTNKNVLNILNDYKISWKNTLTPNANINLSTYVNSIKPIIYDYIEIYILNYNNFFRLKNDIQRGINYYNDNNNIIKNSILKKENKIYNDTSFYNNKNEIYLKLDNLKNYITPNNYNEKFVQVNNEIIERNPDGSYSDDISNNLDEMNNIFYDASYNIVYHNRYNQYLYEHGYGLYVIDGSGTYQRDSSGNRIQKKYKLDSSGNYIYDSNGNKILVTSNISDRTQLLSGMFDIIKCYLLDVNISGQYVSPIYIRDRMYDEYLNYIINPILPSTDYEINLKHIFTFYSLINEIKIPSVLGYLDKNIGDYYNDILNNIYKNVNYQYLNIHNNTLIPTYYKNFDSYKLLFKYIGSLPDDNIYDDTTIRNLKTSIRTTIYNNLYENYNLYNKIVEIMKNAYLENANHFRFGIYNSYTSYVLNSYQPDSRLSMTIQPSSFGLSDNLIDNINSILTDNIYFKNEINTYFNNFIISLGKSIESSVFSDYFNDQSMWSFLTINDNNFKNLLQTIQYNGVIVYTLLQNIFEADVLDKISILNYLPIYLIHDIPNAINSNLSNMGLSALQLSEIDLSDDTFDAPGYAMSYLDTTFNKTQMYKRILENIVFNDNTGLNVSDSDFINAYARSYLTDMNKFSLFKFVRPEKNYGFVIDSKVYFIPNGRAVIEEYRREYYRILQNGVNFTGAGAPTDEEKIKLFEKINLVLDQYMRFDFDNVFNSQYTNNSTYTNYISNRYRFNTNLYYADLSTNPINIQTINNNDNTKYIFAQASIYSAVIKDNTEFYNKFYNDITLSKSYYDTNLGLTMSNLYDDFDNHIQNLDVTGSLPAYEYFSAPTIEKYNDTINIYPRIELDYNLNGLNPSQTRVLKYYVYNQTGTNVTIPVISGYNFNDFQNIISDVSMNEIVDGNNNLVEISTNLQSYLNIYDSSYNELRYLLDIQNKYSKDLSFNTVSTTVDYYNSFFTVHSPYVLTDIIIPTKTMLVDNYYLCGDMFNSSYDGSGLLVLDKWSIKDIIENFNVPLNPFNISLQPNLHESYKYLSNSQRLQINTLFNEIIANITNVIYTDKLRFNLYNNYNTKYDIFNYFKNFIINESDGKFLLRYDEDNITLYNTNISKIIDDYKKYYYGIISKIVYYDGPLPTDQEIEYFNQRLAPYFPIRNIVPKALLYESSELDTVLLGMVTNTPAYYSWVREIAYYMFEYYNLKINGDVFENHNSQLFSLMKKLFVSEAHTRGIDYLIGDRVELYTYSKTNKSNITIYLPLQFWFTKNNTYNSLPLTNILYSDVSISFKLKQLSDLLIMAPYSYIDKEPKIKCSFIVDYVYLEQEERLRIAASKLEFLVEKFNYGGLHTYKYSDIINNQINTKLYFSDPTKFILWRAKIKTTDKMFWNVNGYRIINQKAYNYSEPFTNTNLVSYYPYSTEIPIIKSTKINFNGNTRQEGESGYFNYVVPYESCLGSLKTSEFMYSFSLYPKLLQPSGTANLSVIEDLSVSHNLTDDIISYMKNDNLELEIEYWTMSYQIIRVMSGFIAPAFIASKL
jgi:hypothetical protein